jgi:hypothetical protein
MTRCTFSLRKHKRDSIRDLLSIVVSHRKLSYLIHCTCFLNDTKCEIHNSPIDKREFAITNRFVRKPSKLLTFSQKNNFFQKMEDLERRRCFLLNNLYMYIKISSEIKLLTLTKNFVKIIMYDFVNVDFTNFYL